MRFQKRTDRPVGADGTAPCDLCGQAVAIGPEGYCNLGHRVTTPEMAAAAIEVEGGSPRREPAGGNTPEPFAPVPAPASPEASSEEPVAVASIADVTASAAAEPLGTSEGRERSPALEGFDDLLDFEDLDRRSA